MNFWEKSHYSACPFLGEEAKHPQNVLINSNYGWEILADQLMLRAEKLKSYWIQGTECITWIRMTWFNPDDRKLQELIYNFPYSPYLSSYSSSVTLSNMTLIFYFRRPDIYCRNYSNFPYSPYLRRLVFLVCDSKLFANWYSVWKINIPSSSKPFLFLSFILLFFAAFKLHLNSIHIPHGWNANIKNPLV